VPLAYQGRAFALQSTLKNGTAIAPLLTLGAAAAYFSVEAILIVSPLVLLGLAVMLVQLSIALGGQAPTSRLDVLASFWSESDAPVTTPDGADDPIDVALSNVGGVIADDAALRAEGEDHREHEGA
jgi:hypothetical protein